MKKNYILFFALLLSISVFAQTGKPSFSKSFSTSGNCKLLLETSGGALSVHSSDSDEVRVEFYIRRGNKKVDVSLAELREHLRVLINQEGDEVSITIESDKKVNWRNAYNASLVAYVPKQTSATLNTSGGSIEIEGVNGEQKVRTSGGSLSFKNINGMIDGNTAGGSVTCNRVVGDINLKTSGGSMKFGDITGQIIGKTSGGSIKLDNIKGAADVSTSGGSITGSFPIVEGAIRLRTSGGSIRLDVPDDLGMNIDVQGSSVAVETGHIDGEVKNYRAKGKVNGGGIDVYCRTSAGSVKIY